MYKRVGSLIVALTVWWLSSSAIAACTISKYAEFPITMDGLRPTLTADINGSEQTFIADSGAFFSVISPGTARDLGLKLNSPSYNIYMRGVGGNAEIKLATVKAFKIVGVTIPNVQFIVGGSEPGTAGVIGQNLLGQADVEYDLPHGAIRLIETKGCQKANLAYWIKEGDPYSSMALARRDGGNNHTVGTVKINDMSVRAVFDTGASTTILSLHAAARSGLTPTMPGAKPGGVQSGFGRRTIETWIVPVKAIGIGDEQLQKARVRIGDIGDVTDMLIGADFFISHRVFVSNALHTMFFTYTGGPIFDLTARREGEVPARPGAAAAPEPPLDAAALSRRGSIEASQHNNARAIEDVSKAIALAPDEARYLLQRAELYLENDQASLAAPDIDNAIKLNGNNVEVRLLRAGLRLKEKKMADAIDDLDAAAAAAGTASDQRLAMASLYEHAGAFEKSVAQSSLWIANHPVDVKRPQALNARCWSRALSGRELPQALNDCNAALRLSPRAAAILDSRGLVHLRMGDRGKAIADYDAALKLDPAIGWSLYGRSIAERADGMTQAAKADRDAALVIDPELPALAKQYGIDE